jgi:hypothetical protein
MFRCVITYSEFSSPKITKSVEGNKLRVYQRVSFEVVERLVVDEVAEVVSGIAWVGSLHRNIRSERWFETIFLITNQEVFVTKTVQIYLYK